MRFLLVAPFGIPVDRMRGLLFDGRAHNFERGLVVLGPTLPRECGRRAAEIRCPAPNSGGRTDRGFASRVQEHCPSHNPGAAAASCDCETRIDLIRTNALALAGSDTSQQCFPQRG